MPRTDPQETETLQQPASPPVMGRLTLGTMVLELPIADQHKANRKVLGVLGREVKDGHTGKPVFTFQPLAGQLGYGVAEMCRTSTENCD